MNSSWGMMRLKGVAIASRLFACDQQCSIGPKSRSRFVALMRILVAEDDNVSRRLLSVTLGKWGYEAVAVADGQAAWQILEEAESPSLAILDWMMPGKDGVQICRALRQRPDKPYVYLILLTAKDRKQDVIEGLEA